MTNPCSRSPAPPSARTVTKSGATGTVPKTGKPGWPISKMSPMRTVVATRSSLVTSPLSVFAGRSSARLVCRLSGVPIRPAVYREPLGRFPCHRPPLPVPVRPRFHQPCARLGQVPALRSRGSCLPSPYAAMVIITSRLPVCILPGRCPRWQPPTCSGRCRLPPYSPLARVLYSSERPGVEPSLCVAVNDYAWARSAQ